MDVENQVATVCLLQRTNPNHAKVSEQRTHLGPMFNLANQVRVAGVWLVNNRSWLAQLVTYDEIDFVRRKNSRRILPEKWQRRPVLMPKLLGVRDNILFYIVKIAHDVRQIAIVRFQFLKQNADGVRCHLPVEVT